ncbi:MAG: LlaJI family restriction endonuclease [Prevotella sp.]|nr:LlaJI family restriction endonuclease [Prevotella sp.]
MILLFEGHRYPSALVDKYIKGMNLDGIRRGSRNGVAWKALTYVGYFFNPFLDNPDIVYILPKVFVYKKKTGETGSDAYISEDDIYGETVDSKSFLAFGEFKPEDLIDVNSQKHDAIFMDKFHKYKNFIHQLTIWVYRTVHRYYDRNPKSRACISSMSRNLYSDGKKKKSATWVDYILALIQFSDENKDFFTFVYKQSHSGYNKVNWKKTISSSQPLFKGKKPIYTDFVTKKKTINYDEELLVILFSALKEIKDKYDFPLYINENFNLMSSSEYKHFKKHGVRNMLELKYKYFSDKTIALWNLLYSYFKLDEEISSNKDSRDFLLVNSFHVVFEDMIDYLISDEPSEYPKELKEHYDGKQVDHIYRDKSLVYDNEIYYVGDSKYYRVDAELETKSVQKQYTYAKNIIQRNIDVIKKYDSSTKNNGLYLDYRDDDTEGYNITPNFFISGVVNRDPGTTFNFTDDNLTPSNDSFAPNMHFPNRLFDRDTLILQRYNVNFLYVLSIYARYKNSARMKFREKARLIFKTNLLDYLDKEYSFFRIDLAEQLKEDFIEENFIYLQGKIFSISDNTILLGWKKDKDGSLVEDKYIKISLNEDPDTSDEYPIGSYLMLILPKTTTARCCYTRKYILHPWSIQNQCELPKT